MTKEEINFVTEFVSKTLGTPASEAASLLFDIKAEDGSGVVKSTALGSLLEIDLTRVKTFKDAATTAHDKGYQKAQGEALTAFEKGLKEKFGVTSDKKGLELIEFVVTEKVKAIPGGEQDEDKIKRSTVYLNMVEKLTKEKAEEVKAEADKLDVLQKSIEKESTFKSVSDEALSFIKSELQPILPEGKTPDGKSKSDIQLNKFIKDFLAEHEIEIKDGKKLLLKDGKLWEDPHGKAYDFKEVLKTKAAELWDFKTGEQRSGAGNKNEDNGKGGENKTYSGPIPKTKDEYMEMIKKSPDDKTSQEITKVWVDNQPKN